MSWSSLAEGSESALSFGSIVLAAITAVLGFGSAYLLDLLSSRKNSKKELSWELTTDRPTLTYGVTNAIRLRMTYNGSPVDQVVTVAHRIINTGSERVRNEFIRYELPPGARLLEYGLEPVPPPEMDVEDLTGADPTFPGIRYRIGSIDPGQTIRAVIIADGGDWTGWDGPIGHNAEGHVDFRERELSRQLGEEAYLAQFLFSMTIFAILALLGVMLFVEFWVLSQFPLKTWAFYVYAVTVSASLVVLAANLMRRGLRATQFIARAIHREAKAPVQFHVYESGYAAYSERGVINVPQQTGPSASS